MPTTFIMRAYDPAEDSYVYWETEEFDSAGNSYVGPPAFGTLLNVTCIKVATTTRGDLFVAPFLLTQDRDELTENHESVNFSSLNADVITAVPPFFTTQDRDEPTEQHEGVCFNSLTYVPVADDFTAVPPTYNTQDINEPTPEHEGFSTSSIPSSVDLTAPPFLPDSGQHVNEFYFPDVDGSLPAVPEPMVATTSVAEFSATTASAGSPEPMVATTSVAEFKANNTGPSAPRLDPMVVTTSVTEVTPVMTKPADGADQLIAVTSVSEFDATLDPLVYPNEITQLIGWWDASDESTLLSDDDDAVTGTNDRVKVMDDKSGLGNHFVSPQSPYVRWAKNTVEVEGTFPVGKGYLQFVSKDFPAPYMRINPVTTDWDVKSLTVFGIINAPQANGDWIHYLSQRTNEEGSRNLGNTFGAYDAMRLIEPDGTENGISRLFDQDIHWVAARYQFLLGLSGNPDIIRLTIFNSTGSYTADKVDTISGPSDIVTLGTGIEYPSYALDRYWDNGLFAEAMVWAKPLTDDEIADMARYAAHFWGVTE